MRERDPRVLRIPDEWRDETEAERAQEQIKPRPLEFPPMPRDQREDDDDRDQLKSIRVFAEKAEANEEPGRDPEPERPGRFFQGQPKRKHGGDPKEDRERVDGHDQIPDVKKRDGIEGNYRPEGGAFVEQASRKIIEQQRRRCAEERTPKSHAEFR